MGTTVTCLRRYTADFGGIFHFFWYMYIYLGCRILSISSSVDIALGHKLSVTLYQLEIMLKVVKEIDFQLISSFTWENQISPFKMFC